MSVLCIIHKKCYFLVEFVFTFCEYAWLSITSTFRLPWQIGNIPSFSSMEILWEYQTIIRQILNATYDKTLEKFESDLGTKLEPEAAVVFDWPSFSATTKLNRTRLNLESPKMRKTKSEKPQ
ncbi:unnamed protein product [Vicia faba]|uniref:Uncharacterized protein n=1 Tax=Vicia faba TaxID=3906 RepID=A0AAV1BBF9_VICFA|nr:unnamed protein product [Vicia faba]